MDFIFSHFFYLSVFSLFFFGLLIGSFLNVCVIRIPKGESIVFPSSHCLYCQSQIRWFDLVPLFSFFILKGKCRFCQKSLSWQYPVLESVTGLLAVLVGWKTQNPLLFCVWFLGFFSPLLVISAIDLKHYLIPDRISLPFLILAPFLKVLMDPKHLSFILADSFLGALIGGGTLWGIDFIYRMIRGKTGIGEGDFKLAAMIGAFLGWKGILLVFLFSSCLGSVIGILLMFFLKFGLESKLPFGPFLSAGAMLVWFFQKNILKFF